MKLSDRDQNRLKNYFSKQPDIELAYLYGSYAYGNPHTRSDIDLGILFHKKQKGYDRVFEILDDLHKIGLPAQPEVHEIHLGLSPLFLRNVARGRCLYAKDELKRIRFEVEAVNKFRDTEYLRKVSNYYMQQRLKKGTYGYRPKYII